MANSLTHKGAEYMLHGNTEDADNNGGLTRLATHIRLFKSDSVPNKNGTGFVEVDDGAGYSAGGIAITVADWTFSVVGSQPQVVLDNKQWAAMGGDIENVAGAYLVDAAGNVLVWWEIEVVTVEDGDTFSVNGAGVRLLLPS